MGALAGPRRHTVTAGAPLAAPSARTPPRLLSGEALARALDIPMLLDEIAAGFIAYSAGDVVVPPVGHLRFDDPRGDVHIKYGYVRGDGAFVIKVASGFEGNAAHGLPTGDGLMLVFDARSGFARAILLDHAWLTDVRTAAAGAVAARALAPHTLRRIGIIGAGVQGRLQLRMLTWVTPCREVMVWSRTPAHAEDFAREMRDVGFGVTVAPSASAVAAGCELVVTATTARAPLFPGHVVRPGTHLSAFGADAPGKQELDPALFARADVVVADSRAQCADHGDLACAGGAIALARVRELGEVLADPAKGRTREDEITVCDFTGVAVQDIVIATHVLRRAGANA